MNDENEDTKPIQQDNLALSDSGRSRKRMNRFRYIPLGIATVWLVASIAVGAWLIAGAVGEPETAAVDVPTLSASSSEEFYGGDAYTGIQNAATATEQAVVDGMNGMFDLAVQLEASSAETNSRLLSNLTIGLGVLIIGMGVLTFNTAVQRVLDRR